MNIIERRLHDKYGRRVVGLEIEGEWHKTRVVIVTMPRTYREMYPGQNYLVNNWQHPCWLGGVSQGEEQGKLVRCATLAQARSVAHQMIAAGEVAA